MELTNEQRKYLGLELIDPAWERVEISNSIKPEHETGKGKPKRLNAANLQRFHAEGTYFFYSGYVTLANYTTQQTYYSSYFAGLEPMTEDELQVFLRQWILDTDEVEFQRIQEFATAKRKHCKFKEGDFFRFKIDRTHYGYGRILLDIAKLKKSGVKFWDILMGKPLVISVYHIVTENPEVDTQELSQLKSCPSQFIMDNRFYYGEYEIVGNAPLPENVDYPIMYGRSISGTDRNKIMFQRGRFYHEIPLEGNTLIGECDFKNNGVGFGLYINN